MRQYLGMFVGMCVALSAAGGSAQTASSSPAPSPVTAQETAGRQREPQAAPADAAWQRVLLDRYCVGCHNERLRTANLMLDTVDVEHPGERADVWEKVVQKLRSGAMPPAGRPQPDKAAHDGFVSWLENALDRAAATRPYAARTTIHRLNRAEYANAVRDLLALEIDADSLLPADNSAYGFDNVADVLTTSPGLIERYLAVAQKIGRMAFGDATIRSDVETYFPPPLSRQEGRESEDLPFGTRGGLAISRFFAVDGEYSVRTILKRTVDLELPIGLKQRQVLEVRLDGLLVRRFNYGGGSASEGPLATAGEYFKRVDNSFTTFDVRIPVKAGTHVVGVTFQERTLEPEGLRPWYPTSSVSYLDVDHPLARVERVEIAGPYGAVGSIESPVRRKIFVCRPLRLEDERPCAERILSRLARQAYRRPVTGEDIATIMGFYENGRQERDFDTGIQAAVERILVSPHFLFRIERDPANIAPNTVYRISDLELASRLSFFLWSSIPDQELLDLATRGRLQDPAILAQQVGRMLRDPRSSALVANFVGQWLFLRNLAHVAPDTREFPDFDDDLRIAMRRETELFVESQLREGRSVLDLLRANHTFLNERLARHYGIENVYGSHFRRVVMSDDTRPGLLGHASILTTTSYPNRTSPVERGKWILENILGAPPPAPPGDVPPLPEGPRVKFSSMRERMEQHRQNPTCASCHSKMDPLGFALENFDGVGVWRVEDAGTTIDASGTLPDGTKFDGPAGLRGALLNRSGEFVTTLTTKLLTYALGRGVEPHDMPAVRNIVREASANDYQWSSILLGIAESIPFQMRRSQ